MSIVVHGLMRWFGFCATGDHGRISVILKLINVRDHGNATAAVEVS